MPKNLIAAAVLVLTALTGCSGETEKKNAAPRAPLVEAVQARAGALPLSERVTGTVKARNQVEIRAEVSSPIVEVYVRGGEKVRKGQPLVRHRDDELRDQLRRAEADVQVAEAGARQERARVTELDAQVRRSRSLAQDQLISAAELEQLEAQLAAARAGADEAEARIAQARAIANERRSALSRTLVRAPVDGWIGQRNAEVGMLPRTDSLLFVIGDLDEVIVDIPITQELLGRIRPGTPVQLHPREGDPIRATITRVSPFLAEGSRSTVAEIELPNEAARLTPGMSIRVDVVHGESGRATLVPLSALYEDPQNGRISVFVVGSMSGGQQEQERQVTLRAIEVVARGAGTAGVSGVNEGEWVVSIGQHLLTRDASPVARVRAATWERVMELQGLQREDLLVQFLDKQQQIAKTRGAEPPTLEEYVGGTKAPAAK